MASWICVLFLKSYLTVGRAACRLPVCLGSFQMDYLVGLKSRGDIKQCQILRGSTTCTRLHYCQKEYQLVGGSSLYKFVTIMKLECMSDKVCPFLQKYSECGNVWAGNFSLERVFYFIDLTLVQPSASHTVV